MNCTVCGTNLPDNSAFCPHCGRAVQASPTPLYEQPAQAQVPTYEQPVQAQAPVYEQPMYTQPVYGQPIAPKKKSKAPWIALGVSLFLLIGIVALVIVLLVSCSGADNSSPDAVVTSYFEAIAEDNVDDCLDTIYPTMVDVYMTRGYNEDTLFYLLKNETLGSYATAGAKFSNIVITDREQMAADEVAEANSYMMLMEDSLPITAGVELEGTVTVLFGNTTVPTEIEWSASVVCADGDYYIVDFTLGY